MWHPNGPIFFLVLIHRDCCFHWIESYDIVNPSVFWVLVYHYTSLQMLVALVLLKMLCMYSSLRCQLQEEEVWTQKPYDSRLMVSDTFNYAVLIKMDVLILSIGGPSYSDLPPVEKVKNSWIVA
ncbi:hypothetical protein C5167_036049 [Papaver somniferum]|nr:hypothetical protein C5167_036049 [Papaver somniferum]